MHTRLESSTVRRKRFTDRDIHGEGKEETKFDSLLIASHFGSTDHMTLEGGEEEEAREALCQTSDSFGSVISSRAMLRANRIPNKSHAEYWRLA